MSSKKLSVARSSKHFRAMFETLERRQLLTTTLYVDAASTAATPDGLSWSTAFPSLQSALAIATSGTQIDIAQGTYKPTTGTDRKIAFVLTNGVSLYGGFAGSTSGTPDARNTSLYSTNLSGDIGTVGSPYDNSINVLMAVNLTSTATLDGLNVTGGYAYVPMNNVPRPSDSYGGAMYISASPVTLNIVAVANNFANAGGSGIYVIGASALTVTLCTFTNNGDYPNRGGGDGAAIDNLSSLAVVISNSSFTGNYAGQYGGAINNSSSKLSVDACTFTHNQCFMSGGAIYNSAVCQPITNSNFINNGVGSNISTGGGAVADYGGGVTFINDTFTKNGAIQGGAISAFSFNGAAVAPETYLDCVFSENSANYSGAAIFNRAPTNTFTNCAFAENYVGQYGGGQGTYVITAGGTFTNCSFWNDTTATFQSTATIGGGPTLVNCIVWGTSATPALLSPGMNVTYSDIIGGYPGTGNVNVDPQFVTVPSKGASSGWGGAGDVLGDLRLQSTSPVRDLGNNAALPAGDNTDAAGNPRISNGTVDLGAYELQVAPPPNSSLSSGVLSVFGAAGAVSITAAGGQFTIASPGQTKTYPIANVTSVMLSGSSGSDSFTISSAFTQPVSLGGTNGGADLLTVASGGAFSTTSDLGSVDTNLSVAIATGGYATFSAGQTMAAFTVNGTATLSGVGTYALKTTGLSIGGGGQLDLGSHGLVIDYTGNTPSDSIRTLIAGGKLMSSTAAGNPTLLGIGYVEASAKLGPTGGTFQNQSADGTALLVACTYFGDADLNNAVNGNDYTSIDFAYSHPNTNSGWQNGDFNYDNKIDGSDYSLIDNAFNRQNGPPAALPPAAVVPNSSIAIPALAAPMGPILKTNVFGSTLVSAWDKYIVDDPSSLTE